MPFPLLPKLITDELTDLTAEILRDRHIRLLMLDFDNTIVPYTTSQPTADMELWIKCMIRVGVRMCVVSNSHKDRVKVFCRKYGLPCITHAKKPFTKGIRECLARYNTEAGQAALVGDQIYTDVLGANCARAYSRRFNTMHHNFAENDRIRENVFGYYLDGASSNWTVRDNVVFKTARPLYIQHNKYIPEQNTWHNRAYDIYSTEEFLPTNHHPERDTLVWNLHTRPTLAALFEEFPKAREIFEGAGMDG